MPKEKQVLYIPDELFDIVLGFLEYDMDALYSLLCTSKRLSRLVKGKKLKKLFIPRGSLCIFNHMVHSMGDNLLGVGELTICLDSISSNLQHLNNYHNIHLNIITRFSPKSTIFIKVDIFDFTLSLYHLFINHVNYKKITITCCGMDADQFILMFYKTIHKTNSYFFFCSTCFLSHSTKEHIIVIDKKTIWIV
jgi:hypothetical protein